MVTGLEPDARAVLPGHAQDGLQQSPLQRGKLVIALSTIVSGVLERCLVRKPRDCLE